MGGACISIHALGPQDQLLVTTLTGKRVVNGPTVTICGLLKTAVKRKCEVLEPGRYAFVKTTTTGELSRVLGPALLQLGPYDEVTSRERAITLEQNEYVRLVDTVTGAVRLETGEAVVYLNPTEKFFDGPKKKAVPVDPDTACLVRSRETGNLRLVTTPGLFFPPPTDDIVKVQKLVKLAEYQTVIIADRFGEYHFVSGAIRATPLDASSAAEVSGKDVLVTANQPTKMHSAVKEDDEFQIELMRKGDGEHGGVSFFLPPYCEIVELFWSTGIKKNLRTKKMSIFDSRPWYMDYEFVVRTSDNVELTLVIAFFWSLENIAFMIRNTDDAPGDICHHARSEVIQAVSKVTLDDFMHSFNDLVHASIFQSNDTFYKDRGAKIQSVEVRSFECLDKKIDHVLQEIIKESTDRINRLQLVSSHNEVALEKMKGKIEEERLKGQLIDVKNEHQRKEALIDGEAEAARVNAFIKGVSDITSGQEAIAIFNELRKAEVMTSLANSDAHLYFTPAECDLRLGHNTTYMASEQQSAARQERQNKKKKTKQNNPAMMGVED